MLTLEKKTFDFKRLNLNKLPNCVSMGESVISTYTWNHVNWFRKINQPYPQTQYEHNSIFFKIGSYFVELTLYYEFNRTIYLIRFLSTKLDMCARNFEGIFDALLRKISYAKILRSMPIEFIKYQFSQPLWVISHLGSQGLLTIIILKLKRRALISTVRLTWKLVKREWVSEFSF